jgi:hypothetical protein
MTAGILRTQSRPITHDPLPDTPREMPETRARALDQSDRAYDAALDRLKLSAPLAINGVAPPEGSPAVIQARLDAFKTRTVGPYLAEGRIIAAPPQFRMTHGYNEVTSVGRGSSRRQKELFENQKELFKVADKARIALGDVGLSRAGRGSPEQLRRVTQALIDAGRLPAGPPSTLSDRIRQMQWDHGIGLDCAGYVYGAFIATRHATPATYGLKAVENENFTGLAQNRHFRRVDPTEARPGDIFTLTARPVGHNAIVYSHEIVQDPRRREALYARFGTRPAENFMKSEGRVHVFEVDSSWGAEDGQPFGGVRRETWFYAEGSTASDDQGPLKWAQINVRGQQTLLDGGVPPDAALRAAFTLVHGPCDETIGGVFRPKEGR